VKTLNLIIELMQSWTIKILLLICFLLLGNYYSIAQQKFSHHADLVWDDHYQKLLFDAAAHPTLPNLQVYYASIPCAKGLIKSVELTNLRVTEVISSSSPLKAADLPDHFDLKYNVVEIRGEYFANIMITPFRTTEKSNLEALLSFDIIIYQDVISNEGSRTPPTAIQSVLASGDWYKIGISAPGLIKLDKGFLENTLKIDLSKVNPKDIKVYGNRGGRVPENNAIPRDSDLQQLAIQVVGEEDGRFDSNDAILFYGEGADLLQLNGAKLYQIEKNIYSDQQFYFLTFSAGQGKRIKTLPFAGTPTLLLEDYEAVERVEKDITNLLGSYNNAEGAGQEWYGDYVKTERRIDLTKSFTISQGVVQKPVEVSCVFAARSSASTSLQLKIGQKMITKSIAGVTIKNVEGQYASKAIIRESFNLEGQGSEVSINFPAVSEESEGWLDYLQLTFSKKYIASGPAFWSRNRQGLNEKILGYSLVGQPIHEIWDVTNPYEVTKMTIDGNTFSFEPKGIVHEFYNHNSINSAIAPISGSKINNQNIHGITDAAAVIVFHPSFKAEAERLALHRSNHSKLRTYAIDVQEIYNEFSSGKVDPGAIRDMCKYILEQNSSFKFLTLFGDGSYDYKGLVSELPAENFIPVYETIESLEPILAFPSDDFYGLLSESEGVNLAGALDLGIGRLPAKTAAEAKTLVDKIIHYETSPQTFGDWRLRTGYSADDEDGDVHISDMEEIAKQDAQRHPLYNQQKVYFDAYEQTSTSGENRFPDANKAINQNILNGQIAVTYLGHGGPQGWAQERVLTVPNIISWDNYNSMPIMITATCSFAAYDDPGILTPGEQAILNPNGGAIALYSTTRSVYTDSNKELTDAVNENLYKKVNKQAPRLGQVLSDGKNKKFNDNSFTINSRKFTLLGDAAMQIAMPNYNIKTTTLNNHDAEILDTLSALEKVTLEGIITDESGNLVSNFNGTLSATVFDKISNLQTLGNDIRSSKYSYKVYKNVIFKGNATVKEGKWMFSFWIPKSINYNIGSARVSMYATDGQTVDAAGYYNNLKIGGPTKGEVDSDLGPIVDIFMDTESFVKGGETSSDPLLILKLKDDLGINVTGNAIGQDITAELDNDSKKVLILNDFYQAKKDDFTSGVVRYRLKDLDPGLHTIAAKVWDISGNSAENSTEFIVVDKTDDLIKNVLVYPNPFMSGLHFGFDLSDGPTNVTIDIPLYSIDGKEIVTMKFTAITTGGRIEDIVADESQNLKSILSSGMYYFKIIATNNDGSYRRESQFHKLIKL
jgi:hypothetical protein